MNASPGRVEAIGDARTVFLNEALGPLREWLDNEKVVEIIANGPGELFVEIIGELAMQRVELRAITVDWLRHLAERVAGYSNQSVNAEHPLLSAALATGERFQGVLPPATTNGGAFAIRKQVIKEMSLDDYRKMGSFDRVRVSTGDELSDLDRELCEFLDAGKIEDFIRAAVKHRYTMLLSGGTSSGKTTFLNAILKEVPLDERIITIEDTREVKPLQKNFLPLVASKGDQGPGARDDRKPPAGRDALASRPNFPWRDSRLGSLFVLARRQHGPSRLHHDNSCGQSLGSIRAGRALRHAGGSRPAQRRDRQLRENRVADCHSTKSPRRLARHQRNLFFAHGGVESGEKSQ